MEVSIFRSLYRKYWQFGFQTRLYDALCPQAYLDSLKLAAQAVPESSGRVLDLGCGSGLLLRYLGAFLERGGKYCGTDRLAAGVQAARSKAGSLNRFPSKQIFYLSDMTSEWPVHEDLFDAVVAHFSIYTLASADDRRAVYQKIQRVLRPGGHAIISNPSSDYNARQIISSSLNSVEDRNFFRDYVLRKFLLYPLTYWFGLRYIENQIRNKTWCGYTQDALISEIESAGLKVESVKSVYAGSGYLIRALKPE